MASVSIWSLVAAHESTSGSVPAELMSRLLGQDAKVVVGHLTDLPVALTLPPTLTVDAAVTRRWLNATSVQPLLSSSPSEQRSLAFKARLTAVGLRSFTPPDDAYGQGWGCVDEVLSMPTPTHFCSDDAYAEVFTEEGATNAASVRTQFTVTLNTRVQGFNVTHTPPVMRALTA